MELAPVGADMTDRWIILRTSAARTLALAASLNENGLEAWTPTGRVRRRRKGARERVPAPITPTFVFAPAHLLGDLIQAASAFVSPYPPFSVFRHRDRVPVVTSAGLDPLRSEERRQMSAERREQRRTVSVGTEVRLTEGAFAGMTGVVESASGGSATVNFGSGFAVRIATYLLPEDVLKAAA